MADHEPFAFVKEADLKRLAELFVRRAEEPWLIAFVASRLRPDFARDLLSALPAELREGIGRKSFAASLSRDQAMALDSELRRSLGEP